MKKRLLIAGCIAGALLLSCVILGVLNGLLGDGTWSIGWTDYRYENADYQIGGGTVPSTSIKRIELDWLEGEVKILICQDHYISLTEEYPDELAESSQMRWAIGADGETLLVKFRKSEWFFSVTTPEKQLTLRIPESMLDEMKEIEILTRSANIKIDGLRVDELEIEGMTGDVLIANTQVSTLEIDWRNGSVSFDGTAREQLEIETAGADVSLVFPAECAFDLVWETKRGSLQSDVDLRQEGARYRYNNGGGASYSVETVKGDLLIAVK